MGASGQNGDSLPTRSIRVADQAERILRAMPPSVRLVVIEALPPKPPLNTKLYQERPRSCSAWSSSSLVGGSRSPTSARPR
ncbi:hypothetical protein GS928_24945 [Rhodococcus hoagii]|nr:hypothetical protein [Prescottella equi]